MAGRLSATGITGLRIAIVSLVLGSAAVACYAKGQPVPDEASAVQVAEKVLVPIYGRKQVESERPFTAKLSGNVWIVYGYLLSVIHGK